ncbi:RNA-directed DNA polymerase, eukaryota, reverse transcriptase zinc-binding domain protein [Tanacetum coccineum]
MGWVVCSDAVVESCDAVLIFMVTASRYICDAVSSHCREILDQCWCRRMWGKYGLKDVIVNASGKWDPEIGLEKTEPTTLPMWVKMINIPMKAWSMEESSALASSLGKTKIMEEMTVNMCQFGVGRTDFARVLVEIDAKEDLKDVIKIDYMGKDNIIKGTKKVDVKYDWKPDVYTCYVFGHCFDKCIKRPRTKAEKLAMTEAVQKAKKNSEVKQTNGLMREKNVKNNGKERRELWEDVMRAKRITSGWLWMMIGDFNVTPKNEEHSKGGSRISNDMKDFIDCVNAADWKTYAIMGGMVNEECILKYPQANALFLPYLVSDHSPVVVKIPQSYEKKKKSFIFVKYIVNKEEFLPTVANVWKTEIPGYKMFQLVKKLKALIHHLNAINWKNGNLSEKVERCREDLKMAQANLDKNPHSHECKAKEVDALRNYNEAANDEEDFLYQKNKVDWISNRLKENLMEDQFVNHFQKFLSANNYVNEHHDFEGVFGSKLNNDEALNMAPRPDRYTSIFFKKTWKIMGDDVCLAIREFFMTGKLLCEMNATLISLIPKGASIQGRVIQDTILIAQELLKRYDRKSGSSRCCMKIDVAKAYDTVDWNFLEKQNANFKFHMKCNELKLTHLCFADDMLVVSHGDVESVRIIRVTMMQSRLQLIASVLSSLNVYWATVFLIPKTVVKDIDKILKGFLWCKGDIKKGKAKVAWKTMCSLKVNEDWD